MAIAQYTPKVKPEEAGGWQMLLKAQNETQKWRDNNAPQADNGWGNTQARVDPYNQQSVTENAANQMKALMGQVSPILQQQQQQSQQALVGAAQTAVGLQNQAADNNVNILLKQKQLGLNDASTWDYGKAVGYATTERTNALSHEQQMELIQAAKPDYNERQNQQYIAAKQANAQFGAADTQASAQRDAANAQAQAQKYVAEQAAQANMAGALFGAVGNIASGFGGGRYW